MATEEINKVIYQYLESLEYNFVMKKPENLLGNELDSKDTNFFQNLAFIIDSSTLVNNRGAYNLIYKYCRWMKYPKLLLIENDSSGIIKLFKGVNFEKEFVERILFPIESEMFDKKVLKIFGVKNNDF